MGVGAHHMHTYSILRTSTVQQYFFYLKKDYPNGSICVYNLKLKYSEVFNALDIYYSFSMSY